MNDATTLHLERQLNAPPEKVWRCLTEPDLLRQWFAPRPVEITDLHLDLTPGGIFGFAMHIPEMGEMREPPGCILLVEPQRRLVWTSALGPGFVPKLLPDMPDAFHMTADMRLSPKGEGTLYTATALHATVEGKAAHEAMGFHEGWGSAADQLGELAATL